MCEWAGRIHDKERDQIDARSQQAGSSRPHDTTEEAHLGSERDMEGVCKEGGELLGPGLHSKEASAASASDDFLCAGFPGESAARKHSKLASAGARGPANRLPKRLSPVKLEYLGVLGALGVVELQNNCSSRVLCDFGAASGALDLQRGPNAAGDPHTTLLLHAAGAHCHEASLPLCLSTFPSRTSLCLLLLFEFSKRCARKTVESGFFFKSSSPRGESRFIHHHEGLGWKDAQVCGSH